MTERSKDMKDMTMDDLFPYRWINISFEEGRFAQGKLDGWRPIKCQPIQVVDERWKLRYRIWFWLRYSLAGTVERWCREWWTRRGYAREDMEREQEQTMSVLRLEPPRRMDAWAGLDRDWAPKKPSINWDMMVAIAKKAMRNAAAAKTRVGCCLLYRDGEYARGCNVEHAFQSTTLHAEAVAISEMVNYGGANMKAIACVVVSDREFFTPCGGCRDMLMQYGGPDCLVRSYNATTGELVYNGTVGKLLPHYPR